MPIDPSDVTSLGDLKMKKEETPLLTKITEDFKRLQRQKSRKTGGVEARVLLSLAFAWGEQYVRQETNGGITTEPQDKNKLYLIFNLIAPRIAKLVGRLYTFNPPFKAQPDRKDPEAFAEAEIVDKLILALDEKVGQSERTWEIFQWLLTGGVVFEHVPWIPNSTMEPVPQFTEDTNELIYTDNVTKEQIPESEVEFRLAMGEGPKERYELYEAVEQVGEVGSEVLGPLNVFIDQGVRSVDDLAPDQAVYIAKPRTMGWIEENFGEQIDEEGEPLWSPDKEMRIVTTTLSQGLESPSTASLFLKDMIPTVQGEVDDGDPPIAVVVERYQPSSKKFPRGRYTIFVPGKVVLFDDEIPYEDGDIPLVDIHWHPVTTTFWTKDYVTDLIAPQRFLNKRLSQLGEQANSAISRKFLLAAGLDPEDILADETHAIKNSVNADTGTPLIQALDGAQLPSFFLNSISLTTEMFNDIAGGSDLFQEKKFPGQLRGPLAVPMLQEILDTEWGPFFNHLGDRFAKIKQLRLNRVKQFYPPIRTMHYTDRSQKDEVLIFQTEQMLRKGNNFNVTIQRGELMPELRSLREARLQERLGGPLSILYQDERTGALDKSKIAADLHLGDLGRDSKEAASRKFARQIIDRMWKGEEIPPVLPFYDHSAMLDEIEAEMTTLEYAQASVEVQQVFVTRWQEHSNALQQQAQMEQAGMQSQMVQNAVAQATQQAAAQAASETVKSAFAQTEAQEQFAPDTIASVRQSISGAQGPPGFDEF